MQWRTISHGWAFSEPYLNIIEAVWNRPHKEELCPSGSQECCSWRLLEEMTESCLSWRIKVLTPNTDYGPVKNWGATQDLCTVLQDRFYVAHHSSTHLTSWMICQAMSCRPPLSSATSERRDATQFSTWSSWFLSSSCCSGESPWTTASTAARACCWASISEDGDRSYLFQFNKYCTHISNLPPGCSDNDTCGLVYLEYLHWEILVSTKGITT